MRTYLRVVNPVISLLVLIICLYSSVVDDNGFNVIAPLEQGGIASYFILGKILENMLYSNRLKSDKQNDQPTE